MQLKSTKNSSRQTKSKLICKKSLSRANLHQLPWTTKQLLQKVPGIFNTVKHQQSFLSNDCTSHLFKTIFPDSDIAKKFASTVTKTKSIITGLLGPYAQKILLSELGTQPFSVSVVASNHNQLKLFPLVIKFFNAKVGVQVLNLRLMPSETPHNKL